MDAVSTPSSGKGRRTDGPWTGLGIDGSKCCPRPGPPTSESWTVSETEAPVSPALRVHLPVDGGAAIPCAARIPPERLVFHLNIPEALLLGQELP